MWEGQPADFDTYWQSALDDLERYPAAPEVEPLPIRSTDFATAYAVRLTSVGPYRLFGYLSIPRGGGPFPAIYYPPKYQSVLELIPQGSSNELRSRYVTFSLAGRGQRNSDQPFSAMFPGMLTEGIDDARNYIFRGVIADAVRGQEYLLSRPEVDRSRVVSVGNDVALMSAAMHQGASHLVCTPALFVDTMNQATRTGAYPLEEINDYLNTFPDRRRAVAESLGYMDLRGFAPKVQAATLLMADPSGGLMDNDALQPIADAIRGQTTVHGSESSSYKDGMFMENWMAAEFGYREALLPRHWRD